MFSLASPLGFLRTARAARVRLWALLLAGCMALLLLGQTSPAAAMSPDCQSHAQQTLSVAATSPAAQEMAVPHGAGHAASHLAAHAQADAVQADCQDLSVDATACAGNADCATTCAIAAPAVTSARERALEHDAREALIASFVSELRDRALPVETPPPLI